MTHLPHLRALVDAYTSSYGSSDNWVSSQIGQSRQALSKWWSDGLASMPSPFQLHALSVAIRTPYRDVLDAALNDFNYLPESAAATSEPPARMKRAGQPASRAKNQADTDSMGESQDDGGMEPM